MEAAGAATAPSTPSQALYPKRWRALLVSQIAAFMALLDVSIVNVTLPSIERHLGVSAGTAQWIVSGYALTFGLVLVGAGRLGDTFGRRRMFLIALSAFVVTSALSGAAPTMALLIAARLLQGVAGGMLIPQNSGLIQELFPGAERGRAFGLMGATVGLSTAAGPVVGGLILSGFTGPDNWRWVFYVNVPIGLLALVLAARLLPAATRHGRRATNLDLVGSLLLGAAVLAVLVPVVTAETGAFGRWWPLLCAAPVLFAAFAGWELHTMRRGRQPLLNPRLARIPGFAAGSGIGMAYFTGFTGIWLVLALFFQDGLGYPPLRSGLAVTPYALGVAVAALIAGRLVSRVGRWLTISGLTAVLVGLVATAFMLAHVGAAATPWTTAAPLLLAGLGGGMVTSPNLTLSLQHVPVSMAGAAGGAIQTAQRIGAAVGTAILTTVFYRVLTASGHEYPTAVFITLLTAAGLMAVALMLAVADMVRHRTRRVEQPASTPQTHLPDV